MSVKYLPQLDSLRAFAALAVLAHHFFEDTFFIAVLPLGDLGVRLFFVLSGFLITFILLDARDKRTEGGTFRLFYHFYMRRFFRLFPIYYLYLFIIFFAIYGSTKDSLYFFTYLQNFLFAFQDGFGDYYLLAHFWTLAVEEQFYIVWPFVIIFTPTRYLFQVLIAFVALGVFLRGLMFYLGASHFQASMMVFSHFDTLAIGSCLAYMVSRDLPNLTRVCWISAIAGFSLLVFVLITKILRLNSAWELLLGELGAGLLFVGMINCCRVGVPGLIGRLLEMPWLIYLGKISYGLYVYHLLVFYLLDKYEIRFPVMKIAGLDLLNFFFYTLCAIAVSALSWQIYESPINRFKSKFTLSSASS